MERLVHNINSISLAASIEKFKSCNLSYVPRDTSLNEASFSILRLFEAEGKELVFGEWRA